MFWLPLFWSWCCSLGCMLQLPCGCRLLVCGSADWLLVNQIESLPQEGMTKALQGGTAWSAGRRCSVRGVAMMLDCCIVE